MSEDARPGWTRRGLIWHYTGSRPVDGPEPTNAAPRVPIERRKADRTGYCHDCRNPVERRTVRCWDCHTTMLAEHRKPARQSPDWAIDEIVSRLERNLAKKSTWTTCPYGCLIRPDETCPACIVWAIEDAIAWSWAAAERADRRTYLVESEAA